MCHGNPFQRACCTYRWVMEEWSPCSKTCGKLGYQNRVVQCMQALHNGTNRPVHSKHCTEDRPETRRACNHTTCPAQWRTGAWSQVSGMGDLGLYLYKRITLMNRANFHSLLCVSNKTHLSSSLLRFTAKCKSVL